MSDKPLGPPRYIVPECLEQVRIRHRDEQLLVVEKPAFLLSVPGRGPENRDSVRWRLEQQFPEVRMVHRLDLDTSGLMIIALQAEAQRRLNRAFAERRVDKEYQAVVAGVLQQDRGEIDLPIAPDWQNRPRQKICAERGKAALTRYRVLERDRRDDSTRVQLLPVTGRSHQLRIHLAESGHPILGCDLYAPPEIEARSPRLMLHACAIGFEHPETGQWMRFDSDIPF